MKLGVLPLSSANSRYNPTPPGAVGREEGTGWGGRAPSRNRQVFTPPNKREHSRSPTASSSLPVSPELKKGLLYSTTAEGKHEPRGENSVSPLPASLPSISNYSLTIFTEGVFLGSKCNFKPEDALTTGKSPHSKKTNWN